MVTDTCLARVFDRRGKVLIPAYNRNAVPIVEQQSAGAARIVVALVADPNGRDFRVTLRGEIVLHCSSSDSARAFYEGAVAGATVGPEAAITAPPEGRFDPERGSLLMNWNRGWLLGSRARLAALR